jgi:hypothetical protein
MKWYVPVNQPRHAELLAQGYSFIESRWENEFAVSVYRKDGVTKRVEQAGKILDGEMR